MELVIDIETTITPTDKWKEGQSLIGRGKGDSSPFNEKNKIVSIHTKIGDLQGMPDTYGNATDVQCHIDGKKGVQILLDNTLLLIGHNLKFDLMWLRECGFKYDGEIWDTMLFEYMKAGGQPVDLKLDSCCSRYGIEGKIDKVKEYWQVGVNTDHIPKDIIEEYGNWDVEITHKLYNKQKQGLIKGQI